MLTALYAALMCLATGDTAQPPVQETCAFLPRERGQPSPCNYFGQPRRG